MWETTSFKDTSGGVGDEEIKGLFEEMAASQNLPPDLAAALYDSAYRAPLRQPLSIDAILNHPPEQWKSALNTRLIFNLVAAEDLRLLHDGIASIVARANLNGELSGDAGNFSGKRLFGYMKIHINGDLESGTTFVIESYEDFSDLRKPHFVFQWNPDGSLTAIESKTSELDTLTTNRDLGGYPWESPRDRGNVGALIVYMLKIINNELHQSGEQTEGTKSSTSSNSSSS